MGTFLLYNFQRFKSLEGASLVWQSIPELQLNNGEWTNNLVACKVPVREIRHPDDWEKSSNHVSFLLIPCASCPDAVLPLEPDVFKQTAIH